MILREVRHLRERLDILTASIRSPDRPTEQLAPEEKEEADRTFYVKAQGFDGIFSAFIATLFSKPGQVGAGGLYAATLSRFRPRQLYLNFAYLLQALVVGQWMRRNDVKHLHTHYSSTVALLVQRVFGVDLSISFHGPDEFNDPAGFWIPEKVAGSNFVRAISHYARSQLMKSSATEDWDKIEVVYMGVDPETFAPRPFRRNPSPVEIICVGRLAPVKAQHILIAAVDLLARGDWNVLLHVVGGGPDRESLERDVAKRGLGEHVVFHGFTPQEKLDELYRQADVFALPSFAEGVPGVLMEAMAMEIPCVSTWITGVPELIRNGIDGLLVPPSDTEAFAGAIRQLIDDPDLRLKIGQAGRQRILDKFDLRKNSTVLAGVLERSTSGPTP